MIGLKAESANRRTSFYETYAKRVLDFFLALIALALLWWLLLVVSVMVRVKHGSPVVFQQERPGKDEKIFRMYKFRTMTDERNDQGILLPDVKRLTVFGRFLRNTSLDELPEIFNILKGDMSFVGPRPLLPKYLPLYNDFQRQRHDVRPGLTGLAQVSGRNALTWEERFEYDVEYVNNVSFFMDVKIFFKTISIALFGRNNIDSTSTSEVTMPEFTGTQKADKR